MNKQDEQLEITKLHQRVFEMEEMMHALESYLGVYIYKNHGYEVAKDRLQKKKWYEFWK